MANDKTMLGMLALLAARRMAQEGQPVEYWLDERVRRLAITTPSARVPVETGLKIWRNLPDHTGREPIGLELARQVPVSSLQLLGTAVGSAPHLFGAVQVFCRYFPYLCMLDALSERISGGSMTIVWNGDAGSAPESLRDFVFARIVGLTGELAYQAIRPESVRLSGPAPTPARQRQYEKAFGCGVEFQQSQSRLNFRTGDLSVPLYGSNPALHTSVVQRLGAYDATGASAAARVVGALEQVLDSGDARIEVVAERLGMSPRSVQKNLNAEGYQFSELLRGVRQRRALRLLCETETTVASVSLSLGYGNVGSFSRAFVDWFGCSPGAFRARHRAV